MASIVGDFHGLSLMDFFHVDVEAIHFMFREALKITLDLIGIEVAKPGVCAQKCCFGAPQRIGTLRKNSSASIEKGER